MEKNEGGNKSMKTIGQVKKNIEESVENIIDLEILKKAKVGMDDILKEIKKEFDKLKGLGAKDNTDTNLFIKKYAKSVEDDIIVRRFAFRAFAHIGSQSVGVGTCNLEEGNYNESEENSYEGWVNWQYYEATDWPGYANLTRFRGFRDTLWRYAIGIQWGFIYNPGYAGGGFPIEVTAYEKDARYKKIDFGDGYGYSLVILKLP